MSVLTTEPRRMPIPHSREAACDADRHSPGMASRSDRGRKRRDRMKTGITFGTFDVFHYGHLRILERTRELCDYLIVGVSSDELNFSKNRAFRLLPSYLALIPRPSSQ